MNYSKPKDKILFHFTFPTYRAYSWYQNRSLILLSGNFTEKAVDNLPIKLNVRYLQWVILSLIKSRNIEGLFRKNLAYKIWNIFRYINLIFIWHSFEKRLWKMWMCFPILFPRSRQIETSRHSIMPLRIFSAVQSTSRHSLMLLRSSSIPWGSNVTLWLRSAIPPNISFFWEESRWRLPETLPLPHTLDNFLRFDSGRKQIEAL